MVSSPCCSDPCKVRFSTQHPGADGFEMTGAALQLLGHGMDVAETALQRMVVEDRGRAGGIVGEVDGFASAVDRMCRGHADDDALFDRDQGAGAEMLPDLGHRLQEIGAGGT